MNVLTKVWKFYLDGFRSMTIGRTLWAIILIKLAVMFMVLKVFFFPNMLGGMDKAEKADFVSKQLIEHNSGR